MSRARLVAVGALVLLLAAAPFIPRGGGQDGSLLPAGDAQYVARSVPSGPGRVDAAMRAEIERALTSDSSVEAPCATFEDQQYCVGVGWTKADQAGLQWDRALGRRQAATAAETTGDLSAADLAARRTAANPRKLVAADRAELEAAAAAVAKVVLLRHEILDQPLPNGFLARHPEARMDAAAAQASASATASATKSASASPTTQEQPATVSKTKRLRDYPQIDKILSYKRVSEQTRTYYCGPTTMQMITWGWSHKRRAQTHWASRLGTTSSGTAISDMVRVVNADTGWDKEKYAGKYIVLDISDWSFKQWLLLNARHVTDYHAPLVLHPVLLKKFYPYLDDDASGHFQVGRGYDRRGEGTPKLGYFEPWNQQRFDPSEPYIARVQWRNAYKSYRANQAHFQHNIGV